MNETAQMAGVLVTGAAPFTAPPLPSGMPGTSEEGFKRRSAGLGISRRMGHNLTAPTEVACLAVGKADPSAKLGPRRCLLLMFDV